MKEYKYLKEEYHRGEWQPLMIKDIKGNKIQAFAKITEDQAETLNINKESYNVRYVKEVLEGSVESEFDKVKAEYELLADKKAFHGWSIDQLKEKIIELKK